jgi:hypothetical protein
MTDHQHHRKILVLDIDNTILDVMRYGEKFVFRPGFPEFITKARAHFDRIYLFTAGWKEHANKTQELINDLYHIQLDGVFWNDHMTDPWLGGKSMDIVRKFGQLAANDHIVFLDDLTENLTKDDANDSFVHFLCVLPFYASDAFGKNETDETYLFNLPIWNVC